MASNWGRVTGDGPPSRFATPACCICEWLVAGGICADVSSKEMPLIFPIQAGGLRLDG